MSLTRMRRIEASAEAATRTRARRGRRRFITRQDTPQPHSRFVLIRRLDARRDSLDKKVEFDRFPQDRHRWYVGIERARAQNDEASLTVRDTAAHPIRASAGKL